MTRYRVVAFIFGGGWGLWVTATYGLTPASFAASLAGAVVLGFGTAFLFGATR